MKRIRAFWNFVGISTFYDSSHFQFIDEANKSDKRMFADKIFCYVRY